MSFYVFHTDKRPYNIILEADSIADAVLWKEITNAEVLASISTTKIYSIKDGRIKPWKKLK